jgi:predicted  nucleic acid-binding Zn-ribbon protein
MLPEIEKLLILQDRDQKLVHLRQDLERIPNEEEAAKLRLAGDEKRAADAKAEIQKNEVAMKNLELDIQTRQDSIKKLGTQQFETKKNEEFHRMGEEIQNYTTEVSDLEDRELALMEVGENLQAAFDEVSAKLEASSKLVEEELEALAERRGNCEAQVAELEAERTELASGVDDDLLSTYDRLFSGKGASAVVALEDGQCRGCHMKVIKATAMSARAEKEVTHCENCGRIVYANG